ncbi:hypothetical protein BD410DRAFT_846231 [Rickenella mellea]|uniref:CxC2-like cysteine cluster KDZ transposase-associated domain-containing protein n=1 Tax=Rickenella mellea TaxID=50990 RepID=A0A4Y7PII0_9AGAM|nr:hypothetical protein BD410DRAFT_846231 [Rickenella mellea]
MATSTSKNKRSRQDIDNEVVYHTFEDSSNEDCVDRHRHTVQQLNTGPNRRHDVSSRTTYFTTPKSPEKATTAQMPGGGNESPDESAGFHHTTFQETLDEQYELFLDDLDLEPVRRKQTKLDRPMENWIPHRDAFLDEILRVEGRGCSPSGGSCAGCSIVPGIIRCWDCHGTDIYCEDCTRGRHLHLPLHRVEKRWSDTHFLKTSLKALGVCVQLGHGYQEKCCAPHAGSDTFVVVDVMGIHEVAVQFCGCERAEQHWIQLLRVRWYPASLDYPKSAATFRVLEQFQMHNFESKGSAWHFYRAIARLTDNTGCDPPKDRYEIFMRIVQQWRHIRGLKRSGRGHDPRGVDGTEEGECAVLCPACPQPTMNLPDEWKNAPPEVAWLYTLILAMDANFRLKRKKVSSDAVDPALSKGWSYFVEERAFKDHIRYCPTQEDEPRTCTGFATIRNTNTRDSKGLAATGVAAVVCARHQLVRPTSVGDLQKGERYVNMDYVFLSTLRGQEMNDLILSYDVACQWSVNFRTRLTKFPDKFRELFALPLFRFRTKVPNFHIPAHRRDCHTNNSLHLTSGTGQTDGESIERAWSITNALGPSTKEMGPERRHSTLDDHFGDGNWGKVVNMGPSLLRKMKLAVPQRNEHTKSYLAFTKEIGKVNARKWTELINEWDVDKKKENPYEIKHNTITLADVRLSLAREEDVVVQDGATFLHEVTPSVLLTTGLDLEEQQRRLQADVALQSSDRGLYTPPRILVDSTWTPHGLLMESLSMTTDSLRPKEESIWTPCGLHQESTRTMYQKLVYHEIPCF